MTQIQFDRQRSIEEVARVFQLFFAAGDVWEVRALGVAGRANRTDSGYFNDPARAAEVVVDSEAFLTARGMYFTLNPVMPALLARACNRMEPWATNTTKDHHVVRRTWLPVDCDAERPSGISSSQQELTAALERAEEVREWLMSYGLPEPVSAASGNGAHLLFPISYPNDEESTAMIKRVLEATAHQFPGDGIKIDTSVFNAARIWRLYGTWARKGDSIPERPHRVAEIKTVPDCMMEVSHVA